MPKISVIIPVYNNEKYLNYCLQSVEKQSFSDIEVIIIDDGSSDDSKHICENFAAKDKRFKVYSYQNSGVSISRNRGIEKAAGEYIAFLDGDDWLFDDSLEKLINIMEETNADYVRGSIKTIWPHIDIILKEKDICFETGNDEAIEYFYKMHQSSCAALYKLKIIKKNEIEYPTDMKNGEDSVFLNKYLFFTNRAIFIRDAVYCYNKLEIGTGSNRYYEAINIWRKEQSLIQANAYLKWGRDSTEYYANKLKADRFIEAIYDYLMYCKSFDECTSKIKETIELFKIDLKYISDNNLTKIKKDELVKFIEEKNYDGLINRFEHVNSENGINKIKKMFISLIKLSLGYFRKRKYISKII